MKKILSILLFLFTSFSLFSKGYKIVKVNYELNESSWSFLSVTKQYSLEQNVSIDINKTFETKEEFEEYITDYKIKLQNLRAFEQIEIKENYLKPDKDDITDVELTVITIDSIHLLAVPYPKYDSNTGFILKLKIKDTNFLGSLNTMNSELNFEIDTSEAETKYNFGIAFNFDYPFKAGIFNSTLINDYSIKYTIGETLPEWNAKTGIKFALPKDRITYELAVYQQFVNNLDYKDFNDNFYFNTQLNFATPIRIYETKKYGNLNYNPSINFSVNYDIDGINLLNTDLTSPTLTFSHSLNIGRTNWNNNMRKGFDASISNTYSYNFKKERFYPTIIIDAKYYNNFLITNKINFLNRIGFCFNLYTNFTFVNLDSIYIGSDGTNFGGKLRGIRDTQYDSNGWEILKSPHFITLNFDMPINLFTTNFKSKIMNYFNCNCQISPFIDIGLSYNKVTKQWFNPKDGFYSGGIEVLVYPTKWSSFTVRGSIGIDIGSLLLSDFINTEWRQNASRYEIFFGIGLHY